jgi:predicted phage terminase large subunit-like protein
MLFSRLRKTKDMGDIPIRMRSASNPGDIGSAWVKDRFITNGKKFGRVFIPSRIWDNPSLDADEYINESLSELDPITKARMLEGDWEVSDEGGMFKRDWFQLVTPAEFRGLEVKFVALARAWDTAATVPNVMNPDPDYTAGVLIGLDTKAHFWILSVVRRRGTPKQVDDLMVETAAMDAKIYGSGAVIQVIKKEPSDAGIRMAAFQQKLLAEHKVVISRDSGDKYLRMRPFSNYAQAGSISIVRGPGITDFLDELDCISPEYKGHDDMADSCASAFQQLKSRGGFAVAGSGMPTNVIEGTMVEREMTIEEHMAAQIVTQQKGWYGIGE